MLKWQMKPLDTVVSVLPGDIVKLTFTDKFPDGTSKTELLTQDDFTEARTFTHCAVLNMKHGIGLFLGDILLRDWFLDNFGAETEVPEGEPIL